MTVRQRDTIEPEAGRTNFRVRLFSLIPLVVLLLLFLWVITGTIRSSVGPSGLHYGIDDAAYLAAAQITQDGGNPYDPKLLYNTERIILRRQHLPITRNRPIVRVGSPMLAYWAFEPLLRLPFQTSAYIWMIGMYALAGAGFLAALRYAGWATSWPSTILPLLLFLAMPQTLIGTLFEGNNVGLVCASLGAALLLQARFPFLAGALLTFGWLKPQVALPLAALVVLFHAARPVRAVLGLGSGTAVFLILSIFTGGVRGLRLWIGGLFGYSNGLRAQVDIASLVSLYDRWAPSGMRLGLEVLSLLVALVVTGVVWWRVRPVATLGLTAHHQTETGLKLGVEVLLLWFVWFLASPSAHFYDEILLAAPIVLLLGRNGWRLADPFTVAGLYVLFLSFFVTSWYPLHTSPSSLVVATVGVLFAAGAVRASRRAGARAVLPAVGRERTAH